MLSISAAVFASLQTFLRYPEASQRHKEAASRYGALRREVEEALARIEEGSKYDEAFLSSIRARWDAIDKESPHIPQWQYDQTAAYVEARLGERRAL